MSFGGLYRGRRVLVTGHTGFKGSWLTLWLETLGAQVKGLSLPTEGPVSHWDQLELGAESELVDIRDAERVAASVAAFEPEVVFHLAAQPLVRRSYVEPLTTWSTNVVGTANLLEACRAQRGLKAVVIVTTDKCYENLEWPWPYREIDKLGGKDPYSASKAAAEMVAASYRDAFFRTPGAALIATARAGNVIGGGDWSQDRLIPDLARATLEQRVLEVRNPRSTRPWQHVLDCLHGYLRLGELLVEGRRELAEAWNFGPDGHAAQTVAQVLSALERHWPGLRYTIDRGEHPPESRQLDLDSSKARQLLGFWPVWNLEQALAMTASWYREFIEHRRVISRAQLDAYIEAAGR